MWSYNYYGLDSSDSLSHYGVLGMKWGRRKARVSSGSGSGKSRKKLTRKQSAIKKNVKAYSEQFNKANELSEKADAAWRDVKKQYKDLGKTPVGRIYQVAKVAIGKGSEAAKQYSRDYDRASNMSDRADSAWRNAQRMYQKTGKNFVDRVVNNIKYD